MRVTREMRVRRRLMYFVWGSRTPPIEPTRLFTNAVEEGRGMSLATQSVLQCLHKLPNKGQVLKAISRITSAYLRDPDPWVVGYSGGKDSTALVKLVFQSLLRLRRGRKTVTVIYCDTGVEIPVASSLARQALNDLQREAEGYALPISVRVLCPPVHERYWVKVIGRGYPPPTDKFRWCTDLLRIDPVTRFLESQEADSATVILGVRESESPTRSLTLAENQDKIDFGERNEGSGIGSCSCPYSIIPFGTSWHVNLMLEICRVHCEPRSRRPIR